jgi:hypothetical protein
VRYFFVFVLIVVACAAFTIAVGNFIGDVIAEKVVKGVAK